MAAASFPVWRESDRLRASRTVFVGLIGFGVAIRGDTAVVGAPGGGPVVEGNRSGTAFVFQRIDGTWVQVQELRPSVQIPVDSFGISVAFDGRTIVVGAEGYRDPGGVRPLGTAYVFVHNGTRWIEQDRLVSEDSSSVGLMGTACAVSGDTIVLGADGSFHGQPLGCSAGSAHVFVRRGSSWFEQAVLIPSDSRCFDLFGTSVAIDGDTIFVESLNGTKEGLDTGSVYVFDRRDGLWSETQELTPSDGTGDEWFGSGRMGLQGDTAIIGAPGVYVSACSDCRGAAYVFRRTEGVWVEEQILWASDRKQEDYFGVDVALDGSTALISATGDDDAALESGSVYLFELEEGGWTERQEFWASDAGVGVANNERFGRGLALSGGRAVVGAIGKDGAFTDEGAAYVFERQSAEVLDRNAGTNPSSYAAAPAILGESWTASVDLTTSGHTHARIRGSSSPSARELVGGQTLLVGGAPVFQLPLQEGPVATWTVAVPPDATLAGIKLYTQAVHVLGVEPFALSNAQDLLLGY